MNDESHRTSDREERRNLVVSRSKMGGRETFFTHIISAGDVRHSTLRH